MFRLSRMHGQGRGLIGEALAIGDVRRIVIAFGAVTLGEWVLGTAVAIGAYKLGGALAVGLVGFRFVPAALTGLVTALLGERFRRDRLLTVTAIGRALAALAVAVALAGEWGLTAVVAFVWLDAAVGSAYRPAQAALLPALVRTPGQLTAAASLTSNAKTGGQIFGAVIGGLLLAALSAAGAVAVAVALYLFAAAMTIGVRARVTTGGRSLETRLHVQLRRMLAGVAALRADPCAGRIAGWSCARSLMRGLWTALGVIASLTILGMGESGFGWLMAAAGAGALAGMPLSGRIAGRRHLAGQFAGALALCGVPIAAMACISAAPPALALMVMWGLGMSVSDVGAQVLLNRTVESSELSRVVGLMESAKLAVEGVGALLAPGLVGLEGIRNALLCGGGLMCGALLADRSRFRQIDIRAADRVEMLDLVRRVPLFSPLHVAGLEGVVAQLEPDRVAGGTEVIREGEPGDRWYLVVDGGLEVLVGGYVVDRLGRGGSFGERALMRGQPRSATVRALTDTSLLSLTRESFLSVALGEGADGHGVAFAAPQDPIDALSRQHLLDCADRPTLVALSQEATLSQVAAGHELFRAGQVDDRYLVVMRGEIEIHTASRTWPLRPGDAFGEIGVIHAVPRTASAVASTPATVLSVPGEQVRTALAQSRAGYLLPALV